MCWMGDVVAWNSFSYVRQIPQNRILYFGCSLVLYLCSIWQRRFTSRELSTLSRRVALTDQLTVSTRPASVYAVSHHQQRRVLLVASVKDSGVSKTFSLCLQYNEIPFAMGFAAHNCVALLFLVAGNCSWSKEIIVRGMDYYVFYNWGSRWNSQTLQNSREDFASSSLGDCN